jgi:hypothetical protein
MRLSTVLSSNSTLLDWVNILFDTARAIGTLSCRYKGK